ncbi:MAG: hypothetical protein OHK0053_27640 [Microscillaceae bacterium]
MGFLDNFLRQAPQFLGPQAQRNHLPNASAEAPSRSESVASPFFASPVFYSDTFKSLHQRLVAWVDAHQQKQLSRRLLRQQLRDFEASLHTTPLAEEEKKHLLANVHFARTHF